MLHSSTGRAGLITGFLLAVSSTAVADDLGEKMETGGTVFAIDYFAVYAPRTALDMVERVPGFSIQEDNDDGSRGFGQASGNVLINGQRVSGKSTSASDVLGRIPVDNVERIELVDGTTLDVPGLSGQVVNVITNGGGQITGTWRWKARLRENIAPFFNDFSVSLAGGDEQLGWTVELESEPQRSGSRGWERIVDGQDDLIEERFEDYNRLAEVVTGSASLNWHPASGAIGNLNASYGVFQSDEKEISLTFPVQGIEGRRLFQGSEDEWNTEIGGDYEFDFGPGRLKTIGLLRLEHSPFVNRLLTGNIDGTDLRQSEFLQTIDEGEYILRSEYSLSTDAGHDWQVALEGAFNFLDASSQRLDRNGVTEALQIISTTDSRVEEQRGELTATHGRRLSEDLFLQVSLGAEISELSQSGDLTNVRTFTRPKGFVNLAWEASDTLQIATKLEREVGQLDFFDFISSVNLNAGNGDVGNMDIVPDQRWTISSQIETDLGDWGAFTLEAYYSAIEDIVDRIPIGDGDGPGNLDSAWEFGTEMEGTFRLDRFGFGGGELNVEGEWYHSRVDDPLTGESRVINDDWEGFLLTELRQDIPNTDWAWGISYERALFNRIYRLTEEQSYSEPPGFVYGFIQHKDVLGMTATLWGGNLINTESRFNRVIYTPDRLGSVSSRELRVREFGTPIITFELEGRF